MATLTGYKIEHFRLHGGWRNDESARECVTVLILEMSHSVPWTALMRFIPYTLSGHDSRL